MIQTGRIVLKKINLNVPINSLGYGVVGYNIWKHLRDEVDTTLWCIPNESQIIPPVDIGSTDVPQKISDDINKQNIFYAESPCLKIWHENQLAHRIGKGPMFSWPFFEVSKFDERRKSNLESSDHIIVSSDWAKKVCLENLYFGEHRIHVVPCGVDREIFHEADNNNFKTNSCVFFNCGKWEIRKGHDILHQAFKDAFSEKDNVELWMMTENPFLREQEVKSWQKLYKHPKIKMINRVQYQHQLVEIIKQTYCGVFPSRAEGWNLEALEMMACGKEVIITNYSAHTQFCNEDNSRLINISEEEPIYDGKWFVGENGMWASLEGDAYDQLVNHLRQVYEQWKTNRSNNVNGIQTSKQFSWNYSIEQLDKIIFGG
jgi:glycosyltransferase involved in cell wall biosynthesis